MFYVHARLLERAAKLSKAKGGGSLTALPIAETDAGNLSAYIPTNLISITDGQIVLDAKLFYEGQKPAVDVGVSVSRVGGKTQARALREAAETLRLDYAQFLELEMFTRFGGMPDARVREQLTRGARIRAILDQPQHAPLRLADEVALVHGGASGSARSAADRRRRAFRRGLRDALDRARPRGRARDPDRGSAGRGRASGAARDAARLMRRASPRARPPAGGTPAVTERLADISARIDGIRQLGSVVNAMRGIASARAQQARSQIAAVDELRGDDRRRDRPRCSLSRPRRPRRRAKTEAGPRWCCFAPSRDSPARSANACSTPSAPSLRRRRCSFSGSRGRALAAERGIAISWSSAMPSHSLGVAQLADRVAERALCAASPRAAIDGSTPSSANGDRARGSA